MSNGSFSSNNNSSNLPPIIQESDGPVVINDRYELLELIGQGAMSRVYKALDRVLDRLVAVKLLREEYSSDQNFAARFLREARAVAKLSSPNIVDIYDYGQFHNTYFIVMTYVDGTNLKNLIRRERVLPANTAVTIASEVLLGLAAAHSQGIIHRDVKPQNILIRARDGIAKLTDFGVAYALDGVQITTNGQAIGTAFYMAPEQASARQIGPYTDLYALGVVLFEMLSGRLPFMGENQMQIMLMHVNNPPPTLQSIGVPVSPELDAVVQKALAKDPANRYQSALEMREALLNIPLHGFGGYDGIETVQTSPNLPTVNEAPFYPPDLPPVAPIRPARRGAPWLAPLMLAILILAGLALLGVLFFTGNGHPTPTAQAVLPVITPDTTRALPTATVTAEVPATTQAALPTASPAPLPTVTPSPVPPTATPEPTATPVPPTATAVPPTATPVPPTATPVPPTAPPVPPTSNTIPAYALNGAYKRDDGTLYGRPEVALYGAGSGYDKGTVNFDVTNLPRGQVILTITGIDDERSADCTLQVALNGKVIYNGPSGLPNAPTNDNGEGGTDRFWGTFQIAVPANLFKNGSNSLVLSNATPWTGQLGIPYILINQLQFSSNT